MTYTSLTRDEFRQRNTGHVASHAVGRYTFKNNLIIDFAVEEGISAVRIVTNDSAAKRREHVDAWEVWHATFGTTEVQSLQREILLRLCTQYSILAKELYNGYKHSRLEGVLDAMGASSCTMLLTALKGMFRLCEQRPHLLGSGEHYRYIDTLLMVTPPPGEQVLVYLLAYQLRLQRVIACYEQCDMVKLLPQLRNGEEFQTAITLAMIVLPSLFQQFARLVNPHTARDTGEAVGNHALSVAYA